MFCKQCGNEILDLSLKKCPKCNTAVGKGGRFCPDCGKKLGQGEKCNCYSEKKEEVPKTEISAVNDADKFKIKESKTNTEFQKKEEKPQVSKRIAGNPLLEKIARGDNLTDKSKEIIQQEAAKIVYGKETVEEFEKQREELDTETELENNQIEEGQVNHQKIETEILKTPEKSEEWDDKPSKKCEKEVLEPLKACKEQSAKNAHVQFNTKNEPAEQVLSEPVKPEYKQDAEDSKNLFPEAFVPENMQYNHQNQAPVMHGPVSKPAYQQQPVKKKKSFDGMWVAGLICSILSVSGVKFIPFLIFFVLSLLFGVIDIFLNEKKTGIGILIGDAVIGIYILISTLGGVL